MTAQRKPDRLPPISAALILETVGLELFRDEYGMRECVAHGIGQRRTKLGPAPAGPVRFSKPLGKELHDMTWAEAHEIARDEARMLLAGMCRVCPFTHCKLKDWPKG